MNLWASWLETIQSLLQILATDFGLGTGLAIVVFTLVLRVILLPISWSGAYSGSVHQRKVKKLEPKLQHVRKQYADEPQKMMEKTLSIYQKAGLKMFHSWPLLSVIAQMPVFIGMFHVLRSGAEGAKFLWIESLAKPDMLISLLAGFTTVLMVMANPEMPEQFKTIMIVVPSVIAVVFALKFSSSLAVYWVVSNAFSAIQTVAVHFVIGARMRKGSLKI